MTIFFLIVLSLIPATMLLMGMRWQKNFPKKINMTYGYRTTWSMKSLETWEFAHCFSGKLWVVFSIPMELSAVIVLFLNRNASEDVLGAAVLYVTIVQLAALCLPIIPTEILLRQRFDMQGNKKY